jgi:hypothetical protein
MSATKKARQYNPTGPELTDAVALSIKSVRACRVEHCSMRINALGVQLLVHAVILPLCVPRLCYFITCIDALHTIRQDTDQHPRDGKSNMEVA